MFNMRRISPVMKRLSKLVCLLRLVYWIIKLIDLASNYKRHKPHDLSLQNAL